MKRKAIPQNKELTDTELLESGKRVHAHMTGNDLFPAPFIAMDDLLVAIEAFETALRRAQEGTKEDTALKNEKRKALETLLTAEADYVNAVANGNVAIIDSA